MADFNMSDDEFERLYAEEQEILNELKEVQEEPGNEMFKEFPESIKSTASKDTSNEHPNVMQTSLEFPENPHRLTDLDFSINDPSSVKKRLLDDTSFQIDRTVKKRKSSLPKVGYEIDFNPKVDPDIETIDRIMSYRNMLQKDAFLSTSKERWKLTKRKIKFHQRIPEGDFQSVTTEEGKRIYLEVEDEKSFEGLVEKVSELKDSVRLLPMPYATLRIEAEKEIDSGRSSVFMTWAVDQHLRRELIVAGLSVESLCASRSKNASMKAIREIMKDGMYRPDFHTELLSLNSQILSPEEVNNTSNLSKEVVSSDECDLWVNKYRPQSYLDLLSDEFTNRTVLHWMKLWDKLVFGIVTKSRKDKAKTKDKPKYVSRFAPEVLEDLDEMGRPQQKAVLLCGPPGLGKTTLAHIIAKHAGYNVVEMNASDDRSVEFFRTNLENATTMKSVFGTDRRPNCLIIDEIDGAPAPSINYLVNILQAKQTKPDPLKNKKKDKFTLLRPVICICNDLYTPSLRPLRNISLVIQFPPTQSTRLAHRLYSISQKQNMRADLSVLLALCKKTENDIRSCLSVLQFVRVTSGELKFFDLEGVCVGQKDYQRSLFSVWQNIFTLPRPQKVYRENPHQKKVVKSNLLDDEMKPEANVNKPKQSDASSLSSRFNHILKMSQSCGEYEKLTLGWFENYPTMKFNHTYLEPVRDGLEWAVMTDIFQKEILHSQTWNLGAYIPYAFVAFHFLFASNNWPKLQFPNQYSEYVTKLGKSKSLLDILTRGMSAQQLFFSARNELVQDILPYLMYVIQPELRPVNVQLYSKKEKDALGQLVHTMISYNLTYHQEKSIEGTYSFILDPAVEDVAHFPGIPSPKGISYSSKQLIAREIELERVRRSESYFKSNVENDSKQVKKSPFTSKSDGKDLSLERKKTSTEKPPVPNHLQKLEAKKPNLKHLNHAVARDFFGRVIADSKDSKTSTTNKLLKSDIWFKFKEGYSNAVKRTVRIKTFFD